VILRIINYTVKILIIVFGVLILTGVILKPIDTQMRIVFGIVFILFGIYRLTIYYSKDKKYRFMDEEDDEN
jgi:uncharacterized Tic20 family protein